MLKPAALLIALLTAIGGFLAGMYYARSAGDEYEVPTYEPRLVSASDGEASQEPGRGSEQVHRELVELLRIEDPYERAQKLAAYLADLSPEDVSAILLALEERTIDIGAVEVDLLMRTWARVEPEEAATWALRSSPSAFRTIAILPAIEALARRDPGKAVGFMSQLSGGLSRDMAAAEIALIRGWYDSGLTGLEGYLQMLGVGFARQRALGVFARQAIMRDGPDEIMKWAQSIPDDDWRFKLAAYRQLGSELAQLNIPAAKAWCEAVCDGRFGTNVRALVAQRWAAQDGPAAMAWVSEAPPGDERDWAARGAFNGWWRRPEKRDELMAWYRAQREAGIEPWLEPTLEIFASGLMNQFDVHTALDWASLIQDTERRERTYRNLVLRWRKQDVEAAEEWTRTADISEETRQILLDPPPERSLGEQLEEKRSERLEQMAAKEAQAEEGQAEQAQAGEEQDAAVGEDGAAESAADDATPDTE